MGVAKWGWLSGVARLFYRASCDRDCAVRSEERAGHVDSGLVEWLRVGDG